MLINTTQLLQCTPANQPATPYPCAGMPAVVLCRARAWGPAHRSAASYVPRSTIPIASCTMACQLARATPPKHRQQRC